MTTFSGSCLCGEVQYHIDGEMLGFYHCHCTRCRKFSGTGHATNVRIDSKTIDWKSGESLVKRYKLNAQERFRNDFCGECGSPLPRYFDEVGFVVLPAGTLDEEIDMKPSARIFYASRAQWSCSDDLPTYEEYAE